MASLRYRIVGQWWLIVSVAVVGLCAADKDVGEMTIESDLDAIAAKLVQVRDTARRQETFIDSFRVKGHFEPKAESFVLTTHGSPAKVVKHTAASLDPRRNYVMMEYSEWEASPKGRDVFLFEEHIQSK